MKTAQQKFVICAMTLSRPGTMGGNSKITLEMARYLSETYEVHFIVPEDKEPTFTANVPASCGVKLYVVKAYSKSEFRHPIASSWFYYREIRRVLDEIRPGADDFVYCCGDFHIDSVPCWFLQKRYGFKWLPSAYLFVPGPLENLRRKYGFPFLTYSLAWLYARMYVFFASFRAAGFVITNEDDFKHFPQRFRKGRLFPFYGGVNVEQIPSGPVAKTRDLVFCSRLCAQKGIMGFLDVWKRVHDALPSARFTVIGNGTPEFEAALKARAVALGVADSIDWLGYVNNEAKYEIYRSAKVLAHATIFDNNGMVAAEALCSGLPVVMYDLPPLRHVYTDGCVKVPYGDKDAFAAALVRELSGNSAVSMTDELMASLRRKWDWKNRVETFKIWLEGCK